MTKGILLFLKKLGLINPAGVYYIGGSDILPPPLKGQEETDALEALERGEEKAKQLLIERNLRLVVFIARRFENTGVNLEDLISIGTIGLPFCCLRFPHWACWEFRLPSQQQI